MKKITVCLLGAALLLTFAAEASAQTFRQFKQPSRKQWFAISADWLNSRPLHLKEYPFEQLVGRPLADSQRQTYDYESRGDGGITQVDLIEFRKRSRGFGLAVYPFGSGSGPSLMLRGAVETLPVIRAVIQGPSNISSYEMTGGKAYDAGIGIIVADRSPGWGLGSHAHVLAGVGKIDTNLGGGSRIFAEGGGGLSFGPLGVELGIKFARNKLTEPIDHYFYTVPVTVRATFGF
ncbi:MAG: hypothetical protein M3R55_02240 [Acidobacteriota bacterium]|nr:hypothetical protein [Acidobacteriota bacterium]